MTKREMCKLNKQRAEERMRATPEYQEAERLNQEIDRLSRAGNWKDAKRLCRKMNDLLREARSKQ